MSIGLLFWVLFVVSVVFGVYRHWPNDRVALGGQVLWLVLFFLLGWKTFGFVVQP